MEMDEKLKSNISSVDTWLRLLLIVGFGVLTSVVMMPVIWVLAGVQFLFQLITGQRNTNLHEVHQSLAAWLGQVFSYMLYVSDRKPFPFSDLPEVGEELDDAIQPKSAPTKASPTSKKQEETAEP